jgi:hypothetical protein
LAATERRLVLACGSRGWAERRTIAWALECHCTPWTVVLHGGARGADRIAGEEAEGLGLATRVIRPDWGLGRRAGLVRNLAMLDERPDLVLAFHDGRSRGTAHTIAESGRRGIETIVFLAHSP